MHALIQQVTSVLDRDAGDHSETLDPALIAAALDLEETAVTPLHQVATNTHTHTHTHPYTKAHTDTHAPLHHFAYMYSYSFLSLAIFLSLSLSMCLYE